jgi:cytidylate kinase
LDFIFIFGPQAVGKMTVGKELGKRLNYKLLYNHLTIDLAQNLYKRESLDFIKYLANLNFFTFTNFIKTPSSKGLIYTDVWELTKNYDTQLKHKMFELFHSHGWNVYLVELYAPLDVRLERNKTQNRLLYKPMKRNITVSDGFLISAEKYCVHNTSVLHNFKVPDFVKKHLIIDTKYLKVNEIVEKIIMEHNPSESPMVTKNS